LGNDPRILRNSIAKFLNYFDVGVAMLQNHLQFIEPVGIGDVDNFRITGNPTSDSDVHS